MLSKDNPTQKNEKKEVNKEELIAKKKEMIKCISKFSISQKAGNDKLPFAFNFGNAEDQKKQPLLKSC